MKQDTKNSESMIDEVQELSNGVYYDCVTGDYCTIELPATRKGNVEIKYDDEESDDFSLESCTYVPVTVIHDKLDEFVEIPDKAVDTPAEFIKDVVFGDSDSTDRHDCISPASLHQMELAKDYAMQKVEITRIDETE